MSSVQLRSTSVISAFEGEQAHLSEAVVPVSSGAERLSESLGYMHADEGRTHERSAPAVYPSTSYQAALTPGTEAAQFRNIAPVPRITIQAFCDSHNVLSALDAASRDRLMSRTSFGKHEGGIMAAVEFCQSNAVPNLLIVESRASNDAILAELERLADVCEPDTRVMVIGYSNDIHFYRELLRRGISEYVVAPIAVVPLISTISGIYRDASSAKLGKIYAFVGAKGGVGSSTIAHNVGWTMAQRFGSDVVLADLDLPFGTASLDFNLDVSQGIVEAIQDTSRLDEMLLDRLLTKLDDHFSLLAAPAKLDRPYDLNADAFASLLEVAQANVPFTILDIPHVWTSWARNALTTADEIVITAAPDLANLRNAKNLISFLKQVRPHDAPPRLVLNQIGLAKRPEIKPNEFARALEMEPLAHIPFDAHLFGTAANNGKMIATISSKSSAAHAFAAMAAGIAGRTESRSKRTGLFDLRALLGRKKQAS